MHALFSDAFLAGIGRLSLRVGAVPRGALAGTHLSRAAGTSLQFRDYQAYTPGDDLRRVDWSVYGRTRHLFVRRFERPTAVPLSLLVDASRSMLLESPSRYATAARVAAAVASAAINTQSPVRLLNGRTPSRAVTGRRGFVRLTGDLAAVTSPVDVTLADGVRAMLPTLAGCGPGVVAIISDFFDPGGVGRLIDALRCVPGRLILLRVTQPSDREPDMSGDWELDDCEGGSALLVSADAGALTRYRQAYESYFAELAGYAGQRGATYATFDAASDTLAQLGRLFPSGELRI